MAQIGLENGAALHDLIKNKMHLVEVENEVQFTHTLEDAIESLDEYLNQIQDTEFTLALVDNEHKVECGIVSVDDSQLIACCRFLLRSGSRSWLREGIDVFVVWIEAIGCSLLSRPCCRWRKQRSQLGCIEKIANFPPAAFVYGATMHKRECLLQQSLLARRRQLGIESSQPRLSMVIEDEDSSYGHCGQD